jgi:hypothetical protein
MNREINSFINKYVKEIQNNSAALFLGAGFSKSAGFVDWKELIRGIAEELGLEVDKEHDLVALAQYCYNKKGNRSIINDTIFNEFNKEKSFGENHRIIARLPISTIWTTNYDSLIEDALNEAKRVVDVKKRDSHLAITKSHRDAIVYKMHGDKDNPDEAVLIKDDYEKYYHAHAHFITALSGDLISKTFLFIGFSFTDPNIDYILSRVRIEYDQKNNRQHYAIMRRIKKADYKKADGSMDDAAYEYDKRKHEFFIEDLKRYNIEALLINEYSEITDILNEIGRRLNRNNVFISGSAVEYGKYNEKEAIDFISNLSKRLISEEFNIISGFGLGVGSAVITGALEEIYIKSNSINEDRLLLRPFPQGLEVTKQDELWKKYRQDMISRAGVSIFIFGNKIEKDTIQKARGMISEFEIAKEMHNLIVPVGCTGYVAKDIWDIIKEKPEDYYTNINSDLMEAFERLNDDSAEQEQLIDSIIKFIKFFKGGKNDSV